MVPYNLLDEGKTAAYLDTGAWASKAIKEARYFGNVEVVASSKESTYTYVPKDYTLPENAAYFHVTSNNTIYGTQLKEFRSEEHTSELQSLMRISYAVFCLKKKI